MVSKTLASLDAWLVLAEEVLAEQNARQQKDPDEGPRGTEGPRGQGSYEFDQLSFFPSESA